MATISRLSLGGWIQYDNSVSISRVSIGGWIQSDSVAADVVLDPVSGSLFISGQTPSINLPVSLTSSTGALIITGQAPSITCPVSLTPISSNLQITGQVPTFSTGSGITGEVTLSPQTIADLTDSIVTALMLEIDARKFLTTNKYLALK